MTPEVQAHGKTFAAESAEYFQRDPDGNVVVGIFDFDFRGIGEHLVIDLEPAVPVEIHRKERPEAAGFDPQREIETSTAEYREIQETVVKFPAPAEIRPLMTSRTG